MGVHDGHRERKREQFRQHGLDSFADHEVLELLLFYALPRRDTNPIAHELLARSNATLVALAHNHPSGLAFPSHEDRVATMQIRDALETVCVQLGDHIIVADDDYVSLRQEGLL